MRQTAAWAAVWLLALAGSVPAGRAGGDNLPPPTRKELLDSANKLKQIGLAFHNYQDVLAELPNNVVSRDGKALLSWRVQILPFVDEDALYQQFKLDEPWDGPNNRKLVAKMPKLYAPVRVKAGEGETFYQVFTGEKAMFGPKKPYLLHEIPDGASNTGLVFEAGEPVIWSKPEDLVYDEKKPLPKLGGLFDGQFHVVLGDGVVFRVRKDADEKELRKLIMPADGLPSDLSKLQAR